MENMKEIECAFCKGKGKDPFELLSKLAICQVCSGTGKVEVKEPAIKCAFCKGTGVYPHDGRVTCTVCNGKGMVTVIGETDECPKCKGTAQTIESGLPCIKCGGKGVISKK
jgi:DnaJ-class molecular chaperone